jgi:hypothetical protein
MEIIIFVAMPRQLDLFARLVRTLVNYRLNYNYYCNGSVHVPRIKNQNGRRVELLFY